jgi:hypothetical protein
MTDIVEKVVDVAGSWPYRSETGDAEMMMDTGDEFVTDGGTTTTTYTTYSSGNGRLSSGSARRLSGGSTTRRISGASTGSRRVSYSRVEGSTISPSRTGSIMRVSPVKTHVIEEVSGPILHTHSLQVTGTKKLEGSAVAEVERVERLNMSEHTGTRVVEEHVDVHNAGHYLDTHEKAITRKRVKTIQVPYQRKVKVPVKVQKIIPATVQMQVTVKTYHEEETFEEYEEKYTKIEKRTYTRPKVTWVKKLVPETFTKRVPITKRRTVSRPVTTVVEKNVSHIVDVPGNKLVESKGFRIDEIEDMKKVRIEEIEEYTLEPHYTRTIEGSRRVVDVTTGEYGYRSQGHKIYKASAYELQHVQQDSTITEATDVIVTPSSATYRVETTGVVIDGEAEDGAGVRVENLDLEGEIVTIKNYSSSAISLKGWTIIDAQQNQGTATTNTFYFPADFTLGSWESVHIHSGRGSANRREYDGITHILWEEKKNRPVWNDSGDTAFLIDADGNIISEFTAPGIRSTRRTRSARKRQKRS